MIFSFLISVPTLKTCNGFLYIFCVRPSLQFPFVLLLISASCLIVDKVDVQPGSVPTAQIKEAKSFRSGSVTHRQL